MSASGSDGNVGHSHKSLPIYDANMDWGSSGSLALVMGFLAAPIGFVCLLIVFIAQQISLKPARHHSAIVLVLGDIGRSPRMMYHAESLARHEWETSVIGYGDTPPILSLLEHPRVHLLHLANPPSPLLRLPWILRAPIRILYQVFFVLHLCLYEIPFHTEILLVQNPPSIPTLALAQLVAFLSGAKLIIDWHNTGYSILAMRVGRSSPLVRIAKWYVWQTGDRLTEGSRGLLVEGHMPTYSLRTS